MAVSTHQGAAHSSISWVDSEFGTLREVILCRPTYFEWAAENAIVQQARAAGLKLDHAAAQREYGEMLAALSEAGVTCRFLTPDENLPMQTFTRDSGVVTPWGLLVTSMARPERRGEWAAVTDFARAEGVPIWRKVTAGSVEGGDVQILRPGQVLVGVNEVRTTARGAKQVAAWFAEMGWATRLIQVPAHFLHLDVLFNVASDRVALCATDILQEEDVDWLRRQFELVPVGYREVMRMACNVTSLGEGRVLSTRQNEKINARLRSMGFTVFDPDMEQFVLEGGTAHCLTMPLKRDSSPQVGS
jgi:arginine deiminase